MIGKRPQQQGVGDGEDGSIRADAQGESDDSCERESRILGQHPRAETEIAKECLHYEIIGPENVRIGRGRCTASNSYS